MEDNVALDTNKQKQFVKSIQRLKKRIKKNEAVSEIEKNLKQKAKDGKKPKRRVRGLIYLAHIPHGFYEHEMTQYFSQFGVVTNARVIRSPRTGNSKGYAFVEFKDLAVARIVADTMNNYLMGKRLLKAVYIPPEKQRRHAMRKMWNPKHNPGYDLKIKLKKAYNATKDDEGELKRARKLLSNLSKTKKKLAALGLNYDFFKPVDVPQALAEEKNKANHTEKASESDETTKQHKIKQEQLKNVGVKIIEDFVKIRPECADRSTNGGANLQRCNEADSDDGDESDSTVEFDSEEYEKAMIDEEYEYDSNPKDDNNSDDSDISDEEESGETDDDESEDQNDSDVENNIKKENVIQPKMRKSSPQRFQIKNKKQNKNSIETIQQANQVKFHKGISTKAQHEVNNKLIKQNEVKKKAKKANKVKSELNNENNAEIGHLNKNKKVKLPDVSKANKAKSEFNNENKAAVSKNKKVKLPDIKEVKTDEKEMKRKASKESVAGPKKPRFEKISQRQPVKKLKKNK